MGSLTEADKAIRMLHNIKVVDNQLGPIQVKYANGEAERLGLPVENANPGVDIGKLFVGSLPRGVNEQQVRDIFEQYGSIEEIVLMKDAGTGQTKGCAFVKFSYKENAINAIKNLNGQVGIANGVWLSRGRKKQLDKHNNEYSPVISSFFRVIPQGQHVAHLFLLQMSVTLTIIASCD